MHRVRSSVRRPLFVLVLLAAATQGRADSTVPYALDSKVSILEVGCQGPCACPVIDFPAKGTFFLVSRGFDGLYQNYDVTDVDWALSTPTSVRRFKGSGHYRVGGEFAVTQEMVLDLVRDDGQLQRFSSGLVPGGGEFPVIDIRMAVHGFMCFDSVFAIRALPASASVAGTSLVELRRVWPNPFQGAAEVEIVLARAASVSAEIYDPAGRRVRSLAAETALDAGLHALRWDGLRDDGSVARPGIYRVRVSANGHQAWRTAAKLD